MKHRVYADLPKAGLGNMLLVWSRAKVFSYLNGIPLVTSSWWGFRPGTWIRKEAKKRFYWGYFQETPFPVRLSMHFQQRIIPVIDEPPVCKKSFPEKPVIFRFSQPVTGNDLFEGIKPFRLYIKKEIINLLKPTLVEQLNALPIPVIAIHIRRGDFKLGSTITPNSFFINCIRLIRSETGRSLPVTVFTDADREEINDVLALEHVSLAEKKPDILDLLQMSRSRILILSQTSTFSYWAAFLSEAIIIKPWGEWYADTRPIEINKERFEGKICYDQPETLLSLSQALQKEKW